MIADARYAMVVVPIALLLLQRRHPKKFVDSILGILYLELFRVIVLVLDIHIPGLIVVVIFVLEVVAETSM